MFKKLSLLIGFTQTEIKILLFIIAAFLVGFGYKTFFLQNENNTLKVFDYSKEDSLFYSIEEDFNTNNSDTKDNPVDYKGEILDFKSPVFSENIIKEIPAEKSLDINNIKLEKLMLLPGIGKKTAERIIDLRNKRGRFNSLKELKEIKGIGETKFQNIIKYFYIK